MGSMIYALGRAFSNSARHSARLDGRISLRGLSDNGVNVLFQNTVDSFRTQPSRNFPLSWTILKSSRHYRCTTRQRFTYVWKSNVFRYHEINDSNVADDKRNSVADRLNLHDREVLNDLYENEPQCIRTRDTRTDNEIMLRNNWYLPEPPPSLLHV